MASGGDFNTTDYGGRYLRFSWGLGTQSNQNNTSTIQWAVVGMGNAEYGYYNAGNFRVVIDGETVFSDSTRIQLYQGTQVASGTKVITHNADGTKSFTASVRAGIYTYEVNCTGSASFTLDEIPRVSQPSCITWPEHTQNVGYFGDTISIHMNRTSSEYTHTVRYAFGNLTGTIATGVTNGTTWTIPTSFMDLLPRNTSGSGTIYADTYKGSQLIGTKYCGFTAKVPASVKPTCSIQVLDATDTKDTYGVLIKGLSKLWVKTTGKSVYSSPISKYKVYVDSRGYNSSEFTTGVLTEEGTVTVKAAVTDSRGRISDWAEAIFDVWDYSIPSVSSLNVRRCNADGTLNSEGDYAKVTFSARATALSNGSNTQQNTVAYTLKYKKTTETTWKSVALTSFANNFNVVGGNYVLAADGAYAWDISLTATDKYNSTSRATSVSTAFTMMDFNAAGDGMAIGKVSEKSGTLEVGLPLNQIENRYSFQADAFSGSAGYTALARISITSLNSDAPITFVLNKRGQASTMTVHIKFASSSATTDPALASIGYEGSNYGAFLYKSATSTWTLYVENLTGWSNPCVVDWYTSQSNAARIKVTFPSEQVTTLPTPYYRATPVVLQSIIDCLLPVGTIIHRYDDVIPDEMYPGTTWKRIINRFLWAKETLDNLGATGGEKEVTLAVTQLPAHSHGAVYSGNVSGTKSYAWYTTTGDKIGYETISAGGGEAHNNMPPYIQVSIWRRIS